MSVKVGVVLGVALGGVLAAVRLSRRGGGWPRMSLAGLENRLRVQAIRWSGSLLASTGAVESAARAQQEAMLAHRVASALRHRLGSGVQDLSVLVLGGVIHLEGHAAGPGEKVRAAEIAREASGAQVVADDLLVET